MNLAHSDQAPSTAPRTPPRGRCGTLARLLTVGTALALGAVGTPARASYVVDFETDTSGNKGSYATGTVDLSGIDWELTEALIGNLDGDWRNGGRSARMRGYGTSAMTMLEDKANGLGTLSFQYRRYGTDAQVDWKVEVSTDGGEGWTQVGAAFTAPASDDVQMFSETVNLEGSVRIRIKRATETGTVNRRLNIDDITLTDYSAGGDPVPSLSVVPGTLSGFSYVEGEGPSPEMDYTVSGSGLMGTGSILVEPPAGFEVSTSSGSGFTDWIELPFAGGEVTGQPVTVYVRLAAGLDADDYSGSITHGGGDATASVSVSGTVSAPPLPPPALTAFDVAYGQDFSDFVSAATLPNGWSLDDEYAYQGDFGSGTAGGLRGNGTLGFQLTASGINSAFVTTLTLLNDTGSTIENLQISYLGRVARVDQTGTPKWEVSVDGTPAPELEYSTAGGVDETKQTTLTGLTIATDATFTIEWATTSAGTSGTRRQIGIGAVSVTATEDGEIPNNPPVLTLEPTSVAVFAGEEVLATASATDADDDEVTITVASADIADVATFFDPLTGVFAWTPTAAGTYGVTFTADDGEDQDVKNLTITVGLAAPEDLALVTVGETTATVSWSPVTGATGYRVDVHAVHGEVTEVLGENFDGFSAGTGHPDAHGTNVADALDVYTQEPGWSGERVYQAGGAIKLGVASGLGWIETPPKDLSGAGGVFTIEVDAGAWPTDTTNRSIDVLLDGVVLETLELSNAEMQRFTITGTGGQAASVVRFAAQVANNNRFFLDNLSIGTGTIEFEEVWEDEPVGSASVTIEDLSPGLSYRVVVRATDGTVVSADSDALWLETAGADTPPEVEIDPLTYSVEEGQIVSFLVTAFDVEGHAITLEMDLAGADLVATATPDVYQFTWLADTLGETFVTFVATANGLESDPVVVTITVTPGASAPEPVAPVVQSIALSATEVEVVFAVAGGREDGEGVVYTLWSRASLMDEVGWTPVGAVLTVLDAETAALTATRPVGDSAFFQVRAAR